MPPKNIDQKLKTCKISSYRYHEERHALKTLGYSSDQYDTIILRKYSQNTVKTVIQLSDLLEKKGFSKSDIVKIASHKGGSESLQAVVDQTQALLDLNFPLDAIIKIASNDGGSKTLQAVLDQTQALLDLNFSIDAIVKIASNHGGSKSLQAVCELFHTLNTKGFTHDNIVTAVTRRGNSLSLFALHKAWPLLHKMGLSPAEMAKVAGAGQQTIQAMINYEMYLQNIFATAWHTSFIEAYKTTCTLKYHQPALQMLSQIFVFNTEPGKIYISQTAGKIQYSFSFSDGSVLTGDISTEDPFFPEASESPGYVNLIIEHATIQHGEKLQENKETLVNKTASELMMSILAAHAETLRMSSKEVEEACRETNLLTGLLPDLFLKVTVRFLQKQIEGKEFKDNINIAANRHAMPEIMWNYDPSFFVLPISPVNDLCGFGGDHQEPREALTHDFSNNSSYFSPESSSTPLDISFTSKKKRRHEASGTSVDSENLKSSKLPKIEEDSLLSWTNSFFQSQISNEDSVPNEAQWGNNFFK